MANNDRGGGGYGNSQFAGGVMRPEYGISRLTRVRAQTLAELAWKLEDVNAEGFLREGRPPDRRGPLRYEPIATRSRLHALVTTGCRRNDKLSDKTFAGRRSNLRYPR
jgi:hypothetical protein